MCSSVHYGKPWVQRKKKVANASALSSTFQKQAHLRGSI